MIQLDLLHTIEEQRDQAINQRNKLMMLMVEKPGLASLGTNVLFLAGKISAYDAILKEIRDDIVSQVLRASAK